MDRVFLVTTRSLVSEGSILARVEKLIGDRLVGRFDETEQHAPRPSILKIAQAARDVGATGIVGLGGGSVTDTTRGVLIALTGNCTVPSDFDAFKVRFSPPAPAIKPPMASNPIPFIALPTTLSGGEFTNVAGIVDVERGAKDLYSDDRLAPRTVILDPALAAATPAGLWTSTGVKTMSDAIEQLYSKFSHPVVDAIAAQGIEQLASNLPKSVDGDPDARLGCYVGSWLSLFAVFSAGALPGVGASLRHQVGAVSDAPHGKITAVLLPHVLRFNLPSAPHVIAPLGQALGIDGIKDLGQDEAVEAICSKVAALIASLGLPTRLEEINVLPGDFAQIAKNAMEDYTGSGNPRTVASADELITILTAAQ
jgi:alcohol dehydrogenase class IV